MKLFKGIQMVGLSIVFIGFISMNALAQQSTETKEVASVEIKTTAQCEMCKERIEAAVMSLKGVKSANLNQKDKVLTVKYRSDKTDVATIKSKITETGYDADDLKANEKAYKELPNCCKKP